MTQRNKAMAAWPGNILYWFSCILAALIFVADAFDWFEEPRHRQGGVIVLTGLAVAAVIVWLIGRACRQPR
jgi:hypothetical protein